MNDIAETALLILFGMSITLGVYVLISYIIFPTVHGEEPDILPFFPKERIPCYTINEHEFSPYRCYSTWSGKVLLREDMKK